ncbi:MAG: hypothetical protein LBL39_06055 [Planctomycetaceae bacterium]|nr:hypothetical protein [Planctomycetaceae bacterium]
MRRNLFYGNRIHVVQAILMIVGTVAIFGGGTMLIWNALMPELFGLPTVTFLQACGLVILGRLLVGSHAHALMFLAGGLHLHKGFHRRWNRMTPEEQKHILEQFNDGSFSLWKHGLDLRDQPDKKNSDEKPLP